MAQPIGTFIYASSLPSYGSVEGGAYSYAPNKTRAEYFAGEFTIDTGYDDPVAWTAGVQAAEIYGARVYGRTGTIYPSPGSNVHMGEWRIEANPIWSNSFYTYPSAGVQSSRVLIRCRAWIANPVSIANNSWQRLDTVDWSLYRV